MSALISYFVRLHICSLVSLLHTILNQVNDDDYNVESFVKCI